MPYVSDRQRRFFHAAENRGEISPSTVEHWDKASKGKKLPEKVSKKKASVIHEILQKRGFGPPMSGPMPGLAPNAGQVPGGTVNKPMPQKSIPAAQGGTPASLKPIAPAQQAPKTESFKAGFDQFCSEHNLSVEAMRKAALLGLSSNAAALAKILGGAAAGGIAGHAVGKKVAPAEKKPEKKEESEKKPEKKEKKEASAGFAFGVDLFLKQSGVKLEDLAAAAGLSVEAMRKAALLGLSSNAAALAKILGGAVGGSAALGGGLGAITNPEDRIGGAVRGAATGAGMGAGAIAGGIGGLHGGYEGYKLLNPSRIGRRLPHGPGSGMPALGAGLVAGGAGIPAGAAAGGIAGHAVGKKVAPAEKKPEKKEESEKKPEKKEKKEASAGFAFGVDLFLKQSGVKLEDLAAAAGLSVEALPAYLAAATSDAQA